VTEQSRVVDGTIFKKTKTGTRYVMNLNAGYMKKLKGMRKMAGSAKQIQ
jgi:hypothetical protein